MFFLGSLSLITLQAALPSTWLVASSGLLLIVFLLTSYYAAALVPTGLIEREPADPETIARLRGLVAAPTADRCDHFDPPALPPVVIYSAPSQRDYNGGVLGLGARQVLLISRATIELASDRVLRFVLLHELGHRRYHHILLATLAGWAWTCIGLVVADGLIPAHALATPVYIAHLALWFSIWMAIGEPLLSYLSRRLEYQADRFYLRHGTLAEMRAALSELSQRNLARTDALPRRQSLVQPLPTVANRLRRAAACQTPGSPPTADG
jgi:Zn-dependent protease with chaperone function